MNHPSVTETTERRAIVRGVDSFTGAAATLVVRRATEEEFEKALQWYRENDWTVDVQEREVGPWRSLGEKSES